MRIPRAARTASLALACALTLAGCSDDGEPKGGESTWTPTSTPEQPSTSPASSEKPPALPEAATKATEAGARAFITHYWELIHYAELSGNVRPLRTASGPSCAGCSAGIKGIRQHHRSGGSVTGGSYSPRVTKLTELTTTANDAYAYRGEVAVESAEQTLTSGDGTARTVPPGSRRYTVYVLWVDERWRLDVMEIE